MKLRSDLFRSAELQAWALEHNNLIDTIQLADFFGTLFTVFKDDANGRSLWKAIQEDWDLLTNDSQAESIISQLLNEQKSPFKADTKVSYQACVLEPCAHWKVIKKALKTERRFFAGDLIQDEDKWDVFFANNYTIKSGTEFKRARINEDENKLYTEEQDLGMPPADKATAGRANTYGIPYLYLGTDDLTVMYECRALVNDILSVASFETTADIDVVNFTFKPDLFAEFQQSKDDFLTAVQRYVFLNEVSNDMSKAVRRYDNKEIDYLSTQFVCEYIRLVTGAKGLVFRSAQYPKGMNVVLFDASNVKFKCVEHKVVGTIKMEFQKEILAG